MSGKFRKTVLRVGTYKAPEGDVDVTPERLRHWESEFARMTAASQVVPMHWDHSPDPEALVPVPMDVFHDEVKRTKHRSAANSVGRLESFKVAPDGQSAEIEYRTLTPSATEKVEANAVSVSPVIYPEWKDGAGNAYSDCITHMDLVVHPVDHSQSPAQPVACAIRMGLEPQKIYRMATEPPEDEEGKKKPEGEDGTKNPDGDGDGDGKKPGDDGGATTVPELIEALGKLDIVLPENTNATNFIDRLHTALLTAAAHEGIGEDTEGEPTVDDPQIATMSLQARQAVAYAERQHRETVGGRLHKLLEEGRCTPAEYEAQKANLGVVKLSLDDKGEPQSSKLEDWIESRASVPRGTFWDDEQKLRRMSAQPVGHPDPVTFGDSTAPTDEEADKIAEKMLGG